RVWHSGCDSTRERQPFIQVALWRPCLRVAEVAIEKVHFVPDLEVLQVRSESLGNEFGFSRRALRHICSHADPVEARPSRGLQKFRQIANSIFAYGIIVRLWLAFHFAGSWMIRFR